jgi:hypothetical protein
MSGIYILLINRFERFGMVELDTANFTSVGQMICQNESVELFASK